MVWSLSASSQDWSAGTQAITAALGHGVRVCARRAYNCIYLHTGTREKDVSWSRAASWFSLETLGLFDCSIQHVCGVFLDFLGCLQGPFFPPTPSLAVLTCLEHAMKKSPPLHFPIPPPASLRCCSPCDKALVKPPVSESGGRQSCQLAELSIHPFSIIALSCAQGSWGLLGRRRGWTPWAGVAGFYRRANMERQASKLISALTDNLELAN